MNNRFENYVSVLSPAKQLLAKEAVSVYLAGESDDHEYLHNAKEVWDKSRFLANKEVEFFIVYYMKNNHRIIKSVKIAEGGLDATLVDIRLVMKNALLCGATMMTCVHNHPSGSLKPSKHDDNLTKDIKSACNLLKIKLVDHVIVTDKDYFSYFENGMI